MRNEKELRHNLNVSVIMPFYKRLGNFKKVIKKNAFHFQRNGVEVIIALDSPGDEKDLIGLIKRYPFINWKLIINDTEHDPRNPAPVLNVAIRHATKKFILVSDPEVEFHTDVIYGLRRSLEYYPYHYATGTVAFIEESDEVTPCMIDKLWFLEYGSIMAEKRFFEQISGYDESFEFWGGEDDNLRKRFDMIGIRKLHIPEVRSLHREEKLLLHDRLKRTAGFPTDQLKKIFYPSKPVVNPEHWGRAFERVVYDWQANVYSERLCLQYLESFVAYQVRDKDIFKKSFNKVVLAQSYNEAELINDFLNNMSGHFDGIILLDDESSDDTYQSAIHDKLLLKVKKRRSEFNDLQNRNILLDLASFLKTNWLCFMDIDERLEIKAGALDRYTSSDALEVLAFYFADIWDSPELYHSAAPFSEDGLYVRPRMFRNIGRAQINTPNHKLHFLATPYLGRWSAVPVLVKHLGTITRERRINKFNFYLKEDTGKDQSDYSYLLDEDPPLKLVNEIKFH